MKGTLRTNPMLIDAFVIPVGKELIVKLTLTNALEMSAGMVEHVLI